MRRILTTFAVVSTMLLTVAQASANGTITSSVYFNHEDHGGPQATDAWIEVNGQRHYLEGGYSDGSVSFSVPAGTYAVTFANFDIHDYETEWAECAGGNPGYVTVVEGQTTLCSAQYHYNPYLNW